MVDIATKAAELNEALKVLLNKHDEVQTPKETLFHYTSFLGLKGILESRCIWLTDYKYLNDSSEIEHGKYLILQCIDKHLNKVNPKLNNFLKVFISDIVARGYKTFIISYCSSGDYLPAWRYYSDNGAGFSIGFKKEYFVRKQMVEDKRQATLFFEVEYVDETFTSRVQEILNTADKVYSEWSSQDVKKIEVYLDGLIATLLTILPGVKNNDFKDEHEWRKAMIRIYFSNIDKWHPYDLPMEKLIIDQVDGSRIPPFVKDVKTNIPRLASESFSYSDIDKIYVGPRLDFLTAKLAIQKILIDAGVGPSDLKNITIVESERPFR